MSNEGPQGSKGRLVAKEGSGALSWASGYSCYEFLHEDLKSINSIDNPDAITGDRSQRSERDRAGPYTHGGWIHLLMSPGDAVNWLKWATGGTPTGSGTITYPLATGLTAFSVLVDKVTALTGGSTSTLELYNCYVNQLVVHGTRTQTEGESPPEPDFVYLSVELFGMASTTGTVTFPSSYDLGSDESFRPFEMSDLTFNILSANREVKEFKYLLHNQLYQRRVNSVNPTSIYPQRRAVALRCRVPFDTTNKDLYDVQTAYGAGTVTLSRTVSATTYSTAFAFPYLAAPRHTPVILGKTEIDATFQFAARKSGSNLEVVTTNKAA